jgi:hypothetical protein
MALGIAAAYSVTTAASAQSPPIRSTAVRGKEGSKPEHPLKPAIRVAQTCLDTLEHVDDYECHLTKRELINGRLNTQVMHMRFREKPFSLYCKFGEPYAGREVLYVAGQNDGMMLAHEGSGVRSLFGTVSIPLNGPEATKENRHPLTDAGLRNMVRLMIRQWELESEFGEISVQYYPDARLGDTPCRVIESSHPQPRRQFAFHLQRLYIHAETNLPIRVENYGWPSQPGAQPPLIEEYTYRNIRTNVGFTDRHFDRNCPDYNF